MTALKQHPAKFSKTVLDAIRPLLDATVPAGKVLDPFAGVGRVHSFAHSWRDTVGVELEPEWAANDPRTLVGDALHLPFADDTFDAICTSPCYGSRMSDHHDAKDASKRYTYRHTLGRKLTPGSAGAMQWGERYRQFHRNAWDEALRVLKPNGVFILNISNHIRKGQEQKVMEWHLTDLLANGCHLISVAPVATPRLRHGQNGDVRPLHEFVLAFRGPS